MKLIPTPLPGVVLVEPRVFGDERGFFYESFNAPRFAEHGLPTEWKQDNHSRSRGGVLRGLHYQLHRPQGKLVTCVRGEVFDVAVDIRRGSPTFGHWTSVVLSGDKPQYLWIPPGFAHGFCVLSDVADFVYKCTDVYQADDDRGVLWSDPAIGIDWPIAEPALSPKDMQYLPLDPTRPDLPDYVTP
jgi:dTDP-4-dehydrorhamnose 3,5-epimerase